MAQMCHKVVSSLELWDLGIWGDIRFPNLLLWPDNIFKSFWVPIQPSPTLGHAQITCLINARKVSQICSCKLGKLWDLGIWVKMWLKNLLLWSNNILESLWELKQPSLTLGHAQMSSLINGPNVSQNCLKSRALRLGDLRRYTIPKPNIIVR